MLEEHTYFSVMYTLWKDDEVASAFVPEMLRSVAKATGSTFLKSCTPLLRMFFQSKVVRDLNGQVCCTAADVLRACINFSICSCFFQVEKALCEHVEG